jgi:signal peptidase I
LRVFLHVLDQYCERSIEEMTGTNPSSPAPDDVNVRRTKTRGVLHIVRDIGLIVVITVLLSAGTKTFLIRSFYIPSGSMMNTLQVNDRVIVNELVPNFVAIQHGDVVVFKDPGGWLPSGATVHRSGGITGVFDWMLSAVGFTSPDSAEHLVKRVVGLPGDRVRCCNAHGQMSVNGIALTEPYLHLPLGVKRASMSDFSVTVPRNSYWVMGDSRYNSLDSVYFAVLPTNGFLLSWPVSRWTVIDNFPAVFRGIESGGK